MHRASALVALAVVAAWSTAARATGFPRPGTPGSAGAYAQAIEQLRGRALDRALAVYDAAAKQRPDDAVAAVERCRLLDAVLGREEADDDYDRRDDPRLACRERLAARFPRAPSALFYRLDQLFGRPKSTLIEQLLAAPDIGWSDRDRAELHRQLAICYDLQGRTTEATTEAHAALAVDPALDLSLVIGRELLAQGRRTEAIVQLSRAPSGDGGYYFRGERARLLGEAGAPLRGLALVGKSGLPPVQLGALDELAHKLDDARIVYGRLTDPSARHAALTRLFERAIAGDDAGLADRVYQALRDLGWRADPFGGYRLALARRFPSLPWHKRDAAGGLGFALAILVFLLAPALWIVPLHHWSLWRRQKHAFQLPPPRLVTRWRLSHLWLGCAALFVAQLVSYVVFNYADATAQWWSAANEKLPHVPREVARFGLTIVVGEVALLALFVVRRRDLPLFGPGRWTVRQSFARASLTILVFFVVAVVWLFLVRARAAAGPASVTIEELVLDLRQTYGVTVVVLLVCVLGPIAEELVFRSLLLDVLARSMPFWIANGLQALVFAAAHGELKKIPYLFGVGLLCGVLRARSGGLLASITFHMLNNSVATLVAIGSLSATAPASPPSAPVPSAKLAPELQRCVDAAPAVHARNPLTGVPPAIAFNNAAWRIAVDPGATTDCLRQALSAVDRGLTAMPERPSLLDTEATLFYRQGRFDEAADLERFIVERFRGKSTDYTQLGRFLCAREQLAGPLVLGAVAPADVHLRVVHAEGGQAFEVSVGDPLPDGATLYYHVRYGVDGRELTALLRVQLGPSQQRLFRLAGHDSVLQLEAGRVDAELALFDSRGCEGCAPGSWSWSLQFADSTVESYP